MRVLVLDTGDPAEVSGGQSVFVRNLLRYTRHDVTVACSVPSGVRIGKVVERRAGETAFRCLPIAHHAASGTRPLVPERLRCMLGALMHLGDLADIQVTYVLSAELLAPALFHSHGRPVVFHVRGAANPLSVSRYWWARRDLPVKLYQAFWDSLVRRVSYGLSVDEVGCAAVSSASGGTVSCEVLTPGYDERSFHYDSGATMNPRGLIVVGRLEYAKRIDILIRTLAVLSVDESAWQLTIVGEGGEKGALQSLAQELGVASRCIFTGWVTREELPGVLQRSGLFVLPSVAEGVTTAAIEAIACGLPVIARPVGGLPGLVRPGVNGTLWSGEDPESLALAVRGLVHENLDREAVSASVLDYSCGRVMGSLDDVFDRYSGGSLC